MSHYAYKSANTFVWPVALRSRFNNIGGWHTLTDQERAKQGWYPIEYNNLAYNSLRQSRQLESARLIDGVFKVVYQVTDLSQETMIARFESQATKATKERLDNFADTKGYDTIMTAAHRVNSHWPRLKAEGDYCNEKMDETWNTLYAIFDDVKAGDRLIPDDFESIESELPLLEWPEV
jgi:hypothetical protein